MENVQKERKHRDKEFQEVVISNANIKEIQNVIKPK